MAFIPTPNTAKATLEFDWGQAGVVITLWWKKSTAYSTSDLTSLNGALHTWATDHLLPILSSDIGLAAIQSVAQDSGSAPSVRTDITPAELGDLGVESIPTSSAAVVKFGTPLRGRSFRGRNYIPGLTEGAPVEPGLLGSTAVANFAAAYAALSDVESATGADHVIVSHYADGAARSTGLATTVTSYTVESPLRSQRRREIGVGG